MILIYLILIPVGIFLLVRGAKLVVDAGIYIAQKTGLPRFVVGATVIAFGTSIPEVIVNIIGSANGANDLVIGNIVGTNIANILFVIGIAALIKPISVRHLVATRDIPFAFASIVIFILLIFDTFFSGGVDPNLLSRSDGLILLVIFLIFIYYVAFSHKEHYDELEHELTHKRFTNQVALGTAGLILLILGGTAIVQSATSIAEMLGISNRIIGLTVVAISTSLPELATILVSLKQNQGEIGIGNIVGSNVFNILFILGMSASIRPIQSIESLVLDSFVLALSTLLLIASLFLGQRNKVDRSEGLFFLVIYVVYLVAVLSTTGIEALTL
ncbi:MAG: sodium:calcium antiporter [Candidatus Dojkabacteria bacterium]